MAKKEEQKRIVYVKDSALTVTDITNIEEAIVVKDRLKKDYPEPEFRVRNRLRSRTGMWDVLVKRRTEVKEQRPLTEKEKQNQRDEEFIANHALTGE